MSRGTGLSWGHQNGKGVDPLRIQSPLPERGHWPGLYEGFASIEMPEPIVPREAALTRRIEE